MCARAGVLTRENALLAPRLLGVLRRRRTHPPLDAAASLGRASGRSNLAAFAPSSISTHRPSPKCRNCGRRRLCRVHGCVAYVRRTYRLVSFCVVCVVLLVCLRRKRAVRCLRVGSVARDCGAVRRAALASAWARRSRLLLSCGARAFVRHVGCRRRRVCPRRRLCGVLGCVAYVRRLTTSVRSSVARPWFLAAPRRGRLLSSPAVVWCPCVRSSRGLPSTSLRPASGQVVPAASWLVVVLPPPMLVMQIHTAFSRRVDVVVVVTSGCPSS